MGIEEEIRRWQDGECMETMRQGGFKAGDRGLDLEDGCVDGVLIYDLIHSLARRDEVLAECRRILKNGGILSILPFHMSGRQIHRLMDGIYGR